MNNNIDFSLIQSQKLMLSPRLKQAFDILKMTSKELFSYVQEQLDENPVLELNNDLYSGEEDPIEISKFSRRENDVEKEDINEIDNEDYYNTNDTMLKEVPSNLSLKEYVLFQLYASDIEKELIPIGEFIAGNIDENGYLVVGLSEAARYFNISIRKIKQVLRRMQTFEPSGVCARNLKECLLIQIKQMSNIDKDIVRNVVEGYLENLAWDDIAEVARCTGMSTQRVKEILSIIKTLEPKPGREFYSSGEISYILSDAVVKRIKDKFIVLINESAFPDLNISDYYNKIMLKDVKKDTKAFIQDNINSAKWLIKCIEKRKITIKDMVELIISRQKEFFEKGKKHLKKIRLEDAGKELNIHESILRDALNGKYLQCQWGSCELKEFFNE